MKYSDGESQTSPDEVSNEFHRNEYIERGSDKVFVVLWILFVTIGFGVFVVLARLCVSGGWQQRLPFIDDEVGDTPHVEERSKKGLSRRKKILTE